MMTNEVWQRILMKNFDGMCWNKADLMKAETLWWLGWFLRADVWKADLMIAEVDFGIVVDFWKVELWLNSERLNYWWLILKDWIIDGLIFYNDMVSVQSVWSNCWISGECIFWSLQIWI